MNGMVSVSAHVLVFLVLLAVVAPSSLWRVVLVEIHLHCPCRTRTCTVPLPRSLLILSIVCQAVLLLIRASCRGLCILFLVPFCSRMLSV